MNTHTIITFHVDAFESRATLNMNLVQFWWVILGSTGIPNIGPRHVMNFPSTKTRWHIPFLRKKNCIFLETVYKRVLYIYL